MVVTVRTAKGEVFRGKVAFCDGESLVLAAGSSRLLENGQSITYPCSVWLTDILRGDLPERA